MRERKHIRLRQYDYSRPGGYFVTICTNDRVQYFGNVVKDEMILNPISEIADRCWKELPEHFRNIELDQFVVMPNHVHGIVIITHHPGRDVRTNIPTDNYYSRISPRRGSLGVIIRSYKATVTALCRRNGFHDFVWQRGYYDHIIRNEKSLMRIREYIASNPQRWAFDKENTRRQKDDQFETWLVAEGQKAIESGRRMQ